MSALPPEADMRQRIEYVCFVPIADASLRNDVATSVALSSCLPAPQLVHSDAMQKREPGCWPGSQSVPVPHFELSEH